jgi:hypothetical protein
MEFDGVYGTHTEQATLFKELFSPLVTGFLQVFIVALGLWEPNHQYYCCILDIFLIYIYS